MSQLSSFLLYCIWVNGSFTYTNFMSNITNTLECQFCPLCKKTSIFDFVLAYRLELL